jgi:hypothetical protein
MSLPCAHIGGVPIEETLGSFGPALLIALGAVAAKLRARLLRMRSRGTGLHETSGG